MSGSRKEEPTTPSKPPSGKKPERIRRHEPDTPETPERVVKVTRDDSLLPSSSSFERLVQWLYQNLYIIGILSLRRLRRTGRRLRRRISKIRGGILAAMHQLKNWLHMAWRNLVRRFHFPFQQVREVWQSEQDAVARQRAQGKFPWRPYGRVVQRTLGFIWRMVSTFLNYVAPLVAAAILFSVIDQTLSVPIGLTVSYKDENLGYIQTETDFSNALREMDRRMAADVEASYVADAPLFQVEGITEDDLDSILQENYERQVSYQPSKKSELKKQYEKLSNASIEDKYQSVFAKTEDLTNGIILASSDEITEAFGLYADGQLVGAVLDGPMVLDEIEEIRESKYLGKPDEQVDFDKVLKYTDGIFPVDSIISEEELLDIVTSTEEVERVYTVKQGDTPSGIAFKEGVPVSTLYSLNPNLEDHFVEGAELYISKAKPFLSARNTYTDVYDREIDYEVVKKEDPLYAKSYYKVTRAGVPGIGRVTARVTEEDGVPLTEEVQNIEHIRDPVDELVTIGAQSASTAGGSGRTFIWPTVTGSIGTGLGGYPGHTGVDIRGGGINGTPIKASASGRVTRVTRSYVGYGFYIELSHDNGFSTLYAHCSDIYVNYGDYVQQGQYIGAVGNTGNSTGPHLHFEVRQHGQILNPVDFIGY